jgi:hypothetical protein
MTARRHSGEDPVSASDLYICGALYWLLALFNGTVGIAGFILR